MYGRIKSTVPVKLGFISLLIIKTLKAWVKENPYILMFDESPAITVAKEKAGYYWRAMSACKAYIAKRRPWYRAPGAKFGEGPRMDWFDALRVL